MRQRELAAAAGIGRTALVAIEFNRSVLASSLYDCQKALKDHGIEFWEVGRQCGIFFPAAEKVPFAAFCRAVRAALMASRQDIADIATLSVRTIASLETGAGSRLSMESCLRALQAVGFDYLEVDGRHGLILPDEAALEELTHRFAPTAETWVDLPD